MKNISTILNLFLIIILLAIFYIIKTSSGNYAVLSGSMNPAIPAGSLIVIRQNNRYQPGDIVSFRRFNQTITHRIAGISPDGKFITKGDANPLSDGDRLDKASILGKTYLIIPYLGYLISFALTLQGLIFLVYIPSLILIFSEIRNIFLLILKSEQKIKWQHLTLTLLIIFAISKLNISEVYAYLFSIQIIPDNTVSMIAEGIISPTFSPTPTPEIVLNEIAPHGDNNVEWIEIFNKADHEVDVSGWEIADSQGSDEFPTVSPIPASGYGVIITSNSTVSVPNSAVSIILNSTTIGGFGLNDNGEPVILKDISDSEVDSLSYGNNTTIFSGIPAPGVGQTLIRDPNGIDTDTASDWKLDSSPSIGGANSL